MNARNIVLSVLGASVFAVGTFISWLMWPLPSAQFDWQQIAGELVEHDDCRLFGLYIYNVSHADPEGVADALGRHSLADWCPSIDDTEFVGGEIRSEFFEREINSQLEFDASHQDTAPGLVNSLRDTLVFWSEGRALNRSGVFGFLAWPDLVLGFRCIRPLDLGGQSSWYNARLDSYAVFSGYRPSLISEWENRKAACGEFAIEEAGRIRESLNAETKAEQARDFLRRAERYERLALSWQPVVSETDDPVTR